MAKATTSAIKKGLNAKKKRKGIHSKKRSSTSKTSKNYKKTYKGQGRV